MKIALLMDATLRKQIISEKIINKMKAISEVSMNETSTTDKGVIMKVIQDADIAVTSWGNSEITEELLNCAPNLKMVAHAAGSVKPIVSRELFNRGIKVISCAEVLGRGVAETALGFTISASKNFYNLNNDIANGKWKEHYGDVRELFELKIGVIGCGFAGSHYIHLMKNFDVEIIAYDPFLSVEQISAKGAVKVELEELLRISDIISIHAPSIPATDNMINEETLKLMKDDVIIINTARGTLIDEQALYRAMSNGKIKYACLDVTNPEPPAPNMPLRKVPNCIMTPHLAGLSNNGQMRIGVHVFNEIQNLLSGKALHSEVTQEMLSKIA